MRSSEEKQRLVGQLALRRLWTMWDAGGISWGRSKQCNWLDRSLDLLDQQWYGERHSCWFRRWLSRQKSFFGPARIHPGVQYPLFPELHWYANATIAYALLMQLLALVDELPDGPHVERELLCIALIGYSPLEVVDEIFKLDGETLYAEAQSRCSMMLAAKQEKAWQELQIHDEQAWAEQST